MEGENISKDNLRIALVSFQNAEERVPSMGLVYIATYLIKKCGIKNVRIIDKRFEDIEEEISKFSPHILGLGPMTINYEEAARFAFNFKKRYNSPVIIGGVHISTLPDSMKKCFDISVIGEGEETIAELIDLYLKKGKFNSKDLKKIRGIGFFYN